MPPGSHFVLWAGDGDTTLGMRNALAYDTARATGNWAPRVQFCELFVIQVRGRRGLRSESLVLQVRRGRELRTKPLVIQWVRRGLGFCCIEVQSCIHELTLK